ncbi:tRNA dimethylallyltransferase [Sulfobacillus thermosulfidooxidans DSM 9293]|uniref:tRNA dimethylallyltransferase n=2 Tax=Sulfobacillus thermosulfidooxidans TaxID=28034 RepID=A0A1W1WLA5_SULTA|nr:tRNA (adenosine(37)-N6)-dimethylallyltransferase MiaA [Sulfobacillus thermosulfidooxidans]PSR29745.1 MAG: tRNA (adenosine(37)-N6)-dimethylallyltransferase MiaA [Sulfobacillus thermosulfidooxidans]SMC07098.1 tRNA dimethylallyltransferase [Sulfobacillus thermosulfidooxidans DSM 9293]
MDERGKQPLLILAGPTAVGKTEISLSIAQALHGEIVSCDSGQVFQGLNIGTAKIAPEDRQNIPHFGIDIVSPWSAFSVADYQAYAKQVIAEIAGRGHLPILVGGTGLWIRALVQNYLFSPQNPELSRILRHHIRMIGDEHGWELIRELLKTVDPVSYQAIAPQDHHRLTRALEVFWSTGKPLPRTGHDSPYHVAYWVLTRPLRELHQRIEIRTEQMLAAGLADEVLALLKQGVPRKSQALSAIGYRETVDWAYGLSSETERNQLIILHTKQYAKRQLTWFRSEKMARWLDLSLFGTDRVIQQIVQHAQQTFHLSR